jgi:transglutaminase-like putative cysteine protease
MTANRRMTVTVAFACALSATALYPLFTGSAWFYAGLGAIITVAASGALSRLRTLPVAVCLAISVAGLLLYLNLVFEVRHSWALVIPTPGSLSRLWDLAGTGITDVGRHTAPAPELSRLVLVATGGIAITAILTDLIAVRLRSTALAGLPLLVLFTVPITVNAKHGSIGTLVVFCLGAAGYLAMLSADGRERIQVWGRLVSLWRSGSRSDTATGRGPRLDTRAVAAAGRRVGLASVILALCVPLIVPGLHSSKLLSAGSDTGGADSGGVTSGTVALPYDLKQTVTQLEGPVTPVFSYFTADEPRWASDPPYFREVVYDNLNDILGWVTSDFTQRETQVTQATAVPTAPGLEATVRSDARTVHVTVDVVAKSGLSNQSEPTFLPVPYPPARVVTPPGGWLTDPELMVFSKHKSIPVRTYAVTSYLIDPSIQQLNEAGPPPSNLAPDERLPRSYQVLKQIAEAETKGMTTEYEKVNRLAGWLSSAPFAYRPAPYFDSAAGLITFLTKTRTGVCVQYAYALTVLARSLGIPARMVSGYTGGSHVSGDKWAVKSSDAHAWTEVYFSGYGWITFEATPAGGDGSAHASSYQTRPQGPNSYPTPPPIHATGQSSTPSTGPGVTPGHHLPHGGGPAGGGLPAKSAGTPWAAIVLAVVAAMALACGVIAIVARPARRVRSSRPADGARRRGPATLAAALLVTAATALAALALYRLLSHTSGLDLDAGWATVGIAFGAACAVMFVVPPLGRLGRRRWHWMRATDDTSRAHTAWREFRDDLQDLGVGHPPSEPPRTLADRVSSGLPEPAREAVRRLALAEERASYAARPSGSASLRRDGATARRGLTASLPRGNRWQARIFPVSVMTAVADGAARILDRPGGESFRVGVRRGWARGATSGDHPPGGGANALPCVPSAGLASPPGTGRDRTGRDRPPGTG